MRMPVHRALGARIGSGGWASALAVLGASLACLLLWVAAARAAASPVILEASSLNVASGSATLQAQIDPEGSATTYRFEYGTGTSYGTSVPAPDGSVGSGTSAVTVQAHPQDLTPSTTYHYRVVAIVAAQSETIDGSDGTFTTQAPGGDLTLPDGRAWEQVSPVTKYSGGLLPMSHQAGGGLIQGAEDGQGIVYLATGPVGANPAGNRAPTHVQVLSRRGPAGWESEDLTAPNSEEGNFSGNGSEYRYFSPNLSLGLLAEETNTLLSPEATERTQYLRDNATGSYRPLVTAANVPPGTQFGAPPGEISNPEQITGATSDLRHVVITSQVALTETPLGSAGGVLYEWGEGRLRLVSELNGSPVEAVLGEADSNMRHAISVDGSRVVWEDEESGAGARHLYLRDVKKEATIELDAVQGGSGVSGEGIFELASSDDSKVLFSDPNRLTPDATSAPNEPDLYQCEIVEVAGALKCNLTDLTADQNAGEHADAHGLTVGASEDTSYVYFFASGKLAPGAASHSCGESAPAEETCNLYVRHGGATKFIAAPFYADYAESVFNNGGDVVGGQLWRMTARVSPDGRYLAFMSSRSLTGYDNRDASSGALDEEVYLYDAETGHLRCVSCNPTGARPDGVLDPETNYGGELLVDEQGNWIGKWLAGSLPPWISDGSVGPGEAQYQPRSLLDDGRVFFDSPDALVPQASNGLENVYEYDPVGTGSCTAASATFSASAEGCVALISAGTSGAESVFFDASASGEDVFFMTKAQLVPQDSDAAFDIYDAHVCSGAVPCRASVVAPPACTTADSCRAAPSPQPGVFGAPASATFAGAGNVIPLAAKPAVKGKRPKAKKPGRRAKRKQRSRRGKRAKHKSKTKQSLSAGARR